MKKLITVVSILVAVTFAANAALAKDMILDTKVHKIYEKQDKNGNPYKRFVIKEERELNGVKYQASVLLMVFEDNLEQVADIEPGARIKAVVSSSNYKGKTSYTLVQLLE
jgi:hypothetical protein